VRAVADPAERGPGQRAGHARQADGLFQRRPARDLQHQVQDELDHRRVQARDRERDEGQHPPVVPGRVRRHQRQREPGRDQRHHQGDRHADQAGRGAAPARDVVVAGEFDLRGHRPHRAGHVLGQLADEHHPDRGGQRQLRAEVGQQRPPGHHHAAEPGEHAQRGGGHVEGRQPGQRRVHLRPLRGQPVDGEPGRDHEQPGPQPRALPQPAQPSEPGQPGQAEQPGQPGQPGQAEQPGQAGQGAQAGRASLGIRVRRRAFRHAASVSSPAAGRRPSSSRPWQDLTEEWLSCHSCSRQPPGRVENHERG
jgi:hypothetical protein